MAKLFVSYSRKDSVAARKLIEAFKSIEQDVWVDWESIPPAADWLAQILRGIEEADAFIFMISPDSIGSEVCKVEIGHAAKNNKRIIPIVLRDAKPQDAPEAIRKLNWTFIRESDNFEEGLAKVKTAIELDLDWLEEHRRLQIRALEWHRKKDVSLLLRGRDLRNAEHMLQTYTSKDPIPTDLQRKYIDHSKRTERGRTFAWIATVLVVIALSFLTYKAIQQSNIAQVNEVEARKQAVIAENNSIAAIINQGHAEVAKKEAEQERENAVAQEKLAKAQRSAARAQIYQSRTGELYTSTLLALDSLDESPSAPSQEAQEILRQNISLLPLPVAQTSQAGSIVVLELNPNNETFLAASSGEVCVLSLSDGKELFCEASSSTPNDAIFVNDGKSLVMGDEEGTVKILNAENGTKEREFSMNSPVRDLDTAGKKLTVASENGTIRVIDLGRTNDKGFELGLIGTLTTADLSPNGRWFAAGAQSGHITVWNLDTNKVVSNWSNRGAVLSIKFSKDSRFVTSGGADNYAVGFDTQTRKEAYRFLHADWVEDIAVPSDNSWIATASDDMRVRVWDINSGKERLVMSQDGTVTDVRISPDEKWIASTGDDHTVRVWSAYTGVELLQIPLATSGTALAFSNDTQQLITGDENGNIRIWDISRMTAPAKYLRFSEQTWISKFSPTSDELIVASDKWLWFLNANDISAGGSSAADKFKEFAIDIYDLVVSPNGESIGYSTYGNEYSIYNLKTLIKRNINPSGDAYALAFSSDSSRFITGTVDGVIETWDVKTGELLHSFKEGENLLTFAVAPEDIAAGTEGKIILFDAHAENKIMEIPVPGKNEFLAFNGDGSMLASANSSGQIQLWKEQEDGLFQLQTTLTREQPFSLAFSPQSNLLAVGTTNHVYLIEVNSGAEVARIPHKGIVYSVSISSDGKTLATAALKMIQLWDIDEVLKNSKMDDLQSAACSRLFKNFSKSEWEVLFGNDQPKTLCENLPIPE